MAYNVAVLGASSNPERYSYKAVKMLTEHGHSAFPVHPSGIPVDSVKCYKNLSDIDAKLDVVTVYLSEKNSTPLIDDIISVKPDRVILNPGAENKELTNGCKAVGIKVQEACTLVLIQTGQF